MSINYKFVQLGQHTSPNIVVDKRSDVVRYGSDNMFPNELLQLSVQSSLHTAILDKKVKMGIGKGISYEGPTDKKTEEFIKNPNPYETLDDILEKCYTDLEIFNGFGLQTIWTKDKKSIAEIYHTPFQNIRSSKANEKGLVEEYFYYDDWKKYTRYNDTEILPAFNKDEYKEFPQLLYAKKYSATNLYYPIPSYVGGLNDINTLYQISVFHNACITNNFQPGIMIIFRGPRPTEDEQDAIVKALEEKYKSAKNAGTPSVFFLDSEQESPQIEQTQISDLDKQYTALTEATKENVILSHSIPRIVSGLEKAGSLGGSKEIVEANMVFYNEYVNKNQNFLLNYFNKIGEINGLKEFTIKNTTPSLFLYSENLLREVLTRNEVRDLFGYEELEEDGKTENDDVVIEDETGVTPKNNDEENGEQ